MARYRRSSFAGESERGPKVAAGLMGLAVTLGVVWFGPHGVPNIKSGFAAPTFSGTVTRVVDGDTFYITGQDVRIRVWGLDAPEVGTYGGSAATATMTRLVSGEQVTCMKRDTDRYGRIVGQCFLADGRDITAAMIQSGTSTEYCRFSGNHYRTC